MPRANSIMNDIVLGTAETLFFMSTSSGEKILLASRRKLRVLPDKPPRLIAAYSIYSFCKSSFQLRGKEMLSEMSTLLIRRIRKRLLYNALRVCSKFELKQTPWHLPTTSDGNIAVTEPLFSRLNSLSKVHLTT